MGLIKGLSSLTFLTQLITKKQRESCFKILIVHRFEGYDYDDEKYISFEDLFIKKPDKETYSCKYKSTDYIISCSSDDNLILSRTDLESEDSKLTIDLTNQFCKITENIVGFSYIDYEGDPPKNFRAIINQKELKWLFRINYFGKDFIEKFGKDFFINMPCVKQEFISQDVIRIDLCEDIFSPIDKSLMKKVADYLNSFSIKVNFYNHKNFLIA
jgi:hypothetical protein